MNRIFANNVSGVLASSASASATTLIVSPEQKFPTPGPNEFYALTLVGMSGTIESEWEIVHVTAKSGDQLTVVRGQEGTTARNWDVGTKVELRLTAEGVLTPRHVRQIVGPSTIYLSNLSAVSDPINILTEVQFQILNFASLTNVQVSALSGTATLVGDTIRYTAPAEAGVDTLTVSAEGAERNISITSTVPLLAAPAFGLTLHVTEAAKGVYLYVDPDSVDTSGGAHTATDWQAASDADFSTIVWESLDDPEMLDKRVELLPGTYYFRARTKHGILNSEWSTIKTVNVTGSLTPLSRGRTIPHEGPLTSPGVWGERWSNGRYLLALEQIDSSIWYATHIGVYELRGGKLHKVQLLGGIVDPVYGDPAQLKSAAMSPDGLRIVASYVGYNQSTGVMIFKKQDDEFVLEQAVPILDTSSGYKAVLDALFLDNNTVFAASRSDSVNDTYVAHTFAEVSYVSDSWTVTSSVTDTEATLHADVASIEPNSTLAEIIVKMPDYNIASDGWVYSVVFIIKRDANNDLVIAQKITRTPADYDGNYNQADVAYDSAVALSPDRLTLAIGDPRMYYTSNEVPNFPNLYTDWGGVRIFTRPNTSAPFVKQAEIRTAQPVGDYEFDANGASMNNIGADVRFIDNNNLLVGVGYVWVSDGYLGNGKGYAHYVRSGSTWVLSNVVLDLFSNNVAGGDSTMYRAFLLGSDPDAIMVVPTGTQQMVDGVASIV